MDRLEAIEEECKEDNQDKIILNEVDKKTLSSWNEKIPTGSYHG